MLDFSSKFINEYDIQEMKEAQAFRLLPEFLRVIALKQFTSVSQIAGAPHGKATAWPEAFQWLLRSFATDDALGQAIYALRAVTQHPMEDEIDFYIRLTEARNRYGNVNTMNG